MSWGFEFVATTREEAIKGLDAHSQGRFKGQPNAGMPKEMVEIVKGLLPHGWSHEGISMIVKSNGHFDIMGPSNFSFSISPINNIANGYYK